MMKRTYSCSHIFRNFFSQWTNTWIWEFIAIALSLGLIASVVGVLAAFNGQNLSTWTFPYNVTINAVISTLNTLSKSFLAFALSAAVGQWKWICAKQQPLRLKSLGHIDRSSRGPLGSLQMIWDAKV